MMSYDGQRVSLERENYTSVVRVEGRGAVSAWSLVTPVLATTESTTALNMTLRSLTQTAALRVWHCSSVILGPLGSC